jgi:transposase
MESDYGLTKNGTPRLTPPGRPDPPEARVRTEHAKTWHIDDGTGPDGKDMGIHGPVRRSFSPEYKLAILAEYDGASNAGEKGAILRREGLYSSLLTDWRRQHRQGLLKATVGRADGGRDGASLSEVNRLRAENERLKLKLAQADAIIEVQGKVHALLEDISKSAATDEQ